MYPLMHSLWGDIWKHTVEKSQTNAANVTMPLLRQAVWGDIWKGTVEKSQTNAANVTLNPLLHTTEKSQSKMTIGGQKKLWININ